MDPLASLRLLELEVELQKEIEKTRVMEDWLRAVGAAVETKDKERWKLMKERDRMLAVKEAEDRLVAEFLEADDNGDFDGQNAMMDRIVALMSRDRGDGSNAGAAGSVYGQNTRNQDEGAVTATIEGKNGDAE